MLVQVRPVLSSAWSDDSLLRVAPAGGDVAAAQLAALSDDGTDPDWRALVPADREGAFCSTNVDSFLSRTSNLRCNTLVTVSAQDENAATHTESHLSGREVLYEHVYPALTEAPAALWIHAARRFVPRAQLARSGGFPPLLWAAPALANARPAPATCTSV